MKFLHVITLFTCATISMNALAATEGHGYKILSETIETSPGTQGGFTPSAEVNKNFKPTFVQASSQTSNAQGAIHTNIRLVGHHSFSISNTTHKAQVYAYKFELNCGSDYVRKTDYVQVYADGIFTSSDDSYLYTSHSSAGFWTINAITDVSGESSNSHISSATLKVFD